MFVHTTCRWCGGPLLLGSGASSRGPAQIGWWRDAEMWHGQDPCKPVGYPRDAVEYELRYSLRMLAAARREEMAAKWEAKCRQLERELDKLGGPPKLAEAAVLYARWGWPVFPLLVGGKKPATRNGFKDATTDVVRIQRYWAAHPAANIGIATGHLFDVIDVDAAKRTKSGRLKESGFPALEKALAAVDPADGRGPLPDCYGIAATPSGGLHLLIEPTGTTIGEGIVPGIDYRGIGGYIVAAPSVTVEGRYRWEVPPAPQVRRRRG